MGAHVDIHEQRLQAEQLRKAKEAAESAARATAAFLANMSHEIRTRMNAIVSAARLLEGTRLSREQEDLAEPIPSPSGSLLGIVNDVLDFSKIESGKLQLESVPFAPRELVRSLERPYWLAAGKKGVSLESRVDSRLPNQLMGDPTRLQQVLTNLLANAVKFTSQGVIRL